LLPEIPLSLQQAIESNTLIPLVGAGVSRAITNKQTNKQNQQVFPGWEELLKRCAVRLRQESSDDADLVDIFIKKRDWQQAARYAHEGLKGTAWSTFFNQQFAPDFDDLSNESAALPKAI
jgi:hypothetical protein